MTSIRDAGRRRWRIAAAGIVAAVALAGTGCATLGRAVFQEPVVNFKSVRVNGLGLTGGSLDIVLSVYNPNNFRLQATRLTYNLMMDSVRVADGALDSDFVVQSGDSSEVVIPVNFTYGGLGRAGQELLRSGTVNYRVLGDVTVATPLGNFTRPYDQTGRFSPLRGTTR
ncbi:MAG TPA: LEA type 2 family protein [Gemmatimonadales bacterium]